MHRVPPVNHPSGATLAIATTGGTAHWDLPTTHPSGATLAITTTPTAAGVLSVHLAPPAGTWAVEVCLPAADDEHFYGLGERFGRLNLAGQVMANWTADQAFTSDLSTSYSPMPFLLSSQGYGLLVDTTAYATFDLRHTMDGSYCICVATGTLALALIAGPHPHTILERYTAIVGRPPLPPLWAFGVWKNVVGGPERVEQEVARLRAALKPYSYHYAYIAHTRGLPILRPLFLNYPDEGVTYTLHDEYLVGDDLLVAPVLTPGQTTRTLYLPTGAWCHYWTGDRHTGPGWVTVPAPLYQIPLFVRAGAALQLPALAHVTAQPQEGSGSSSALRAP